MSININGVVNFIKLNNNKYEINIFVFKTSSNHIRCENTYDNINIDKYLIKLFKRTKNKYNFYIPIINDDFIDYKLYNYDDQVLKIINGFHLFKNIKFKQYYYPFDSIKLTYLHKFYNYYLYGFGFLRNEINYLIIDLKHIIDECTELLNIDLKNIIDKVENNNKIILNNILNNYFINKIKIIIDNCTKLLIYIDNNIEFIKYKYRCNDKYYEIQKNIYKMNDDICTSILFIYNFVEVYYIIIEIINDTTNKNIIYASTMNVFIMLGLLINYFNFNISYISYSDNIIDNDSIVGINKIFKNMDIMNTSTINFLNKYLLKENNHEIVHCINLDNNILN